MILYLDTSALVKLFADEPGSGLVREAVACAEFRGCHLIGYAEACAALARRGREHGLSGTEIEAHITELRQTWSQLDVVETTWPLVQRAGHLAVQLRLRGYDSVHLAAAEAVWVRVGTAAEFRFMVFDTAVAEAAQLLGMAVYET